MHGSETRNDDPEIHVVDPNSIELYAEWRALGPWARALGWVFERCRNQAALMGCLAIVAVVYISGTDDPLVIIIALLSIVAIAVATEWIAAKRYGIREKREAASCDAAQD